MEGITGLGGRLQVTCYLLCQASLSDILLCLVMPSLQEVFGALAYRISCISCARILSVLFVCTCQISHTGIVGYSSIRGLVVSTGNINTAPNTLD